MVKVLPEGLGIWIWQLSHCDNGDVNKILERCKSCGIKWIGIKSGDGQLISKLEQVISDLIAPMHAQGIKVYTWNYSKPSTWVEEIVQIKKVFELGVDGHIIDAEIEWQNEPNNKALATKFLTTLREAVGDVFIAHSPFAVVNYHSTFPYAEFGKYCDAVMPQVYWTEFNWDMQKSVSMTDSSWNLFNINNPGSVKPVWPIGVTYGKGYPGVQGTLNQEEIVKFLKHYNGMPVSLYSYDAASSMFHQTFDTLAKLAVNQAPVAPEPPPEAPLLPEPTPAPDPSPTPLEPIPAPSPLISDKTIWDILRAVLSFLFHIRK